MKSRVIGILLLSLISKLVTAQTNYYYYNGNRLNIVLDKSRINIITDVDRNSLDKSLVNSENYLNNNQKIVKTYLNSTLSIEEFEEEIKVIKQNKFNTHISYFYKSGDKSLGTSNLFYICLKDESDVEKLQEVAIKRGVEIIGQIPFMEGWYVLKIPYNKSDTSIEASNYFFETGLFKDVDPGFIFEFSSDCTNDSMFNSLWGLSNSSNPSVDINACEAWNISQGANVKVAVVDQGIEKSHNDLISNISALSFNSMNGTSPSFEPSPTGAFKNGHGTQVAGVIGAISNNNLQVVGVAPQSKLMSVSNDLYPYRSTITAELASGISWAYQNGADIINNSWGDAGGTYYSNFHSAILESAIINAMNLGRNGKGSIVIFAAGNQGYTSPIIDYPANFNDNIIVVGAVTSSGNRSVFSGYGTKLDIVAPGSGILTTGEYYLTPTTYVLNSTQNVDGTSFAAPHVSGVFALMLAVNPNLTRCQAVKILENTAQKIGGYSYTTTSGRSNGTWNNEMGYGLIDAHAAVLAAQSTTGSLPVVTGANLICSSQSYSVSGAPAGSTFSWTSSYASGLTINASGVATRINAHCGQVTVTAVVNSNGCTAPAAKNVWVGAPILTNQRLDGMSYYSPTYICPGNHWLQVTPVGQGATNALWTVQSGVPHIATPNYLDFTLYSNVSSIAITARSQNSCGLGTNSAFYLMRKDWGCSGSFSIAAYPNPATNELVVEVMSSSTDAINPFVISSAYMLNENGVTVSDGKENNGKQRFDTSKLKKGVYYLHVQISGEYFKERILIE